MNTERLIHLSILLPHEVFLDIENITRLQISTSSGSFGVLPQRIDAVAGLTPGLMTFYDSAGGEHFVAFDQGIFTKAGHHVTVAVRNAISGANLGELHLKINDGFRNLNEEELKARQVMAQLETGFIRNFESLTRK